MLPGQGRGLNGLWEEDLEKLSPRGVQCSFFISGKE